MYVMTEYTPTYSLNDYLKVSGIVLLLAIITPRAISLGSANHEATEGHDNETTFPLPDLAQDINYLSCRGVNNGSFKRLTDILASMPTDETVVLDFPYESDRIVMEFTVLEPINSYIYCAGLSQYNITRKNYNPVKISEYGFNSSIANAAIYVGEDCWTTERSSECVLDVVILQEILQLPIMTYRPDDDDFWNFNYKLFDVSYGWLKYLSFSAFRIDWDHLASLNNTSIEELKITNNTNVYAPSHVPDLPLLRILDLLGSRFENLPIDQLDRSPELEKLILAESDFVTDVQPLFRIQHQLLKVLDISKLRYPGFTIFRYAFSGLPALEELDLSHNTLAAELPPFTHLPKLKTLRIGYLYDVNIRENVDMFKNLPALEILDLSGNDIFYLPTDLFDYQNLTELYLSFNDLYNMDSVLLANKNLKILDMSHNRLNNWPTLISCRIEYLNMSYNGLQYLSNLSLNDTLIKYMDISRNNISIWSDVDVFVNKQRSEHRNTSEGVDFNANWVEVLDISRNSIQAVSNSMILSMERLRSVNLLGNDFDCSDCSVPSVQAWLNGSSCPVLHPETLQCSSPLSKVGRKVRDVEFFEEKCLLKPNRLLLQIGIPLIVFTVLCTSIGTAIYWYRYEITYIIHLLKLRGRNLEDQSKTSLYDAFICYSGNDRAWVMSYLAPALERRPAKYRLCLHDRDFPLGSTIVHNIVHSIEESRRTIVILTEEFINSKWCTWELEMANHRMFENSKNFLILLELERVSRKNLPRHLKLMMDTRTYLEWPEDRTDKTAEEAAMKRLKKALGYSISYTTSEEQPLLENYV